MMKISNNIAPLLIVILLGLFSYPQLRASINKGDTIQLQEEPYKKQKFSGFIIDASPADKYLYQQQTEIADEMHVQLIPSTSSNKPVTVVKTKNNAHSKKCSKDIRNNPANVACNPECIKYMTNPKK